MKRLIGFCAGIILSLNIALAQSHPVPDTVISRVVDELIVCDGVKVENTKLRKTVTLYAHSDSLFRIEAATRIKQIVTYKADSISFRKTIASKEETIKQNKWKPLVRFLEGTLAGAAVLAIYQAATQE